MKAKCYDMVEAIKVAGLKWLIYLLMSLVAKAPPGINRNNEIASQLSTKIMEYYTP